MTLFWVPYLFNMLTRAFINWAGTLIKLLTKHSLICMYIYGNLSQTTLVLHSREARTSFLDTVKNYISIVQKFGKPSAKFVKQNKQMEREKSVIT